MWGPFGSGYPLFLEYLTIDSADALQLTVRRTMAIFRAVYHSARRSHLMTFPKAGTIDV